MHEHLAVVSSPPERAWEPAMLCCVTREFLDSVFEPKSAQGLVLGHGGSWARRGRDLSGMPYLRKREMTTPQGLAPHPLRLLPLSGHLRQCH